MNKELEGKIKQIVGEAVGYGSLCWEPRPVGVFNSTEASKAVDEAVSSIAALMPEPLAVLADRKGKVVVSFISRLEPKECWVCDIRGWQTFNEKPYGVQFSADTYEQAESLAREYLEKMEDGK